MIYGLINENSSSTPLSIAFSQSIQQTCRKKHLITLSNKRGFCNSYDSVQRYDTSLTTRTIREAGQHHVPVPSSIASSSSIIHGAMDNVDKNDGGEGIENASR